MPFRLRPSRRARARWACTAPVRVSSSPTGGGGNTGPARSRASGQPFRTLSRISRSRERSGAEQTPSVSNLVSPYRMCPASFSGISGFIDRADINLFPCHARAHDPNTGKYRGFLGWRSLLSKSFSRDAYKNIIIHPLLCGVWPGPRASPHAMLACVCQRRAGA